MVIENKTTYLIREVITRVARLCFEDKLVEKGDKIPLEMISRSEDPFRCCFYKDRAMIKFRAVAAMGF